MKKKLTANQEKALSVLVNTPIVSEAARECGLHRNTLFTYLADETFKAELHRRKAEQLQEGEAELRGGIKEAAQELRKIITRKGTSDQTRINAINTLLTHAARFAELVELEDQLLDIAARQDEIERRKNGGF